MTKIIINADDFGLSKGVNFGIVESHLNGVLSSTTMMVTMPAAEHATRLMKFVPNLGVGLHLNISLGQPLTKGKTIVDSENQLIKPQNLGDKKYAVEEVYQEFKAQYKRFIELTGQKPSHFDTHLFSSDKIEAVRVAATRLANEEKLPLRNIETDSFKRVEFITFRKYGDPVGLDYLFNRHQDFSNYDYIEIMSHPSFMDHYILENSSYNMERLKEMEILTSPELKRILLKNNNEIITYNEVPRKK